jgi:hypothetical protein
MGDDPVHDDLIGGRGKIVRSALDPRKRCLLFELGKGGKVFFMVLPLLLEPGEPGLLHMLFFLGKMDPRVVIKELDRTVDLFLAPVLFYGKNEIVDPFEQFFMLSVDRRDADR